MKRQGRYPQAEEFYKKAIQQDPKFSEAFSNLGNVYLAQKQIPSGHCFLSTSDRFKSRRRGLIITTFIEPILKRPFFPGKRTKFFRRARQLDPQLVDSYSKIDSPHINRLVIDEVLTTERLWRRFSDQLFRREGFLFWLFNGWFEKIPSRIPLLVPVVFLGFLIGMSSYGQTKRFLTRCPMCGTSYLSTLLWELQRKNSSVSIAIVFLFKRKNFIPELPKRNLFRCDNFKNKTSSSPGFSLSFSSGSDTCGRNALLRDLFCSILFFIFLLRFIYWNGVIPVSYCPAFRESLGE